MKILVVKLSSMGDVISALPAITDIKKKFPEITIDWVLEENFIEIPKWHPAINEVIPFSLRRWRKKIWCPQTIKEMKLFLKKLRGKNYDYIIDAQGLIKSAIVSVLAHGKRYGFSSNNVREPITSIFYNYKFDIPKEMHVVRRIRELFALSLSYKVNPNSLSYGIMNSFSNTNAHSNEKYFVFVHGASRDNKLWPEERWIELAKLVEARGFKIKLPWGNEQEFIKANNIANSVANAEVLPNTTLTDIGNILFYARAIITVDTGFAHLAAALEKPTIALYGPTSPNRGGAYGKNQNPLNNMQAISAEMVWEKINRAILV